MKKETAKTSAFDNLSDGTHILVGIFSPEEIASKEYDKKIAEAKKKYHMHYFNTEKTPEGTAIYLCQKNQVRYNL